MKKYTSKKYTSEKITIQDTDIIQYMSQRGWAIVIMPDNLRIDNHHGFVHIHFNLRGEKIEIKETNLDILFDIIVENVTKNKKLNLDELRGDLL